MTFFKSINKKELAVALLLAFSLGLGNFSVFGQQCDALRADVVRLHIMANSDGEIDQAVKLKIRDRILQETSTVFAQPSSHMAACEAAMARLPQIEKTAAAVLKENGVDMPVRAEFCNMYFTTRTYEDYTLPAGMYDAVRVVIGEGAGHNWWCVLYPPICVPAAQPDSPELDEIRSLDAQPVLKPKLALVEAFEHLKESVARK